MRPHSECMKTMNAAQRRVINERLVQASAELKSLNRTRGPLGHGVVHIADKAERFARLSAEIESLRAELAA